MSNQHSQPFEKNGFCALRLRMRMHPSDRLGVRQGTQPHRPSVFRRVLFISVFVVVAICCTFDARGSGPKPSSQEHGFPFGLTPCLGKDEFIAKTGASLKEVVDGQYEVALTWQSYRPQFTVVFDSDMLVILHGRIFLPLEEAKRAAQIAEIEASVTSLYGPGNDMGKRTTWALDQGVRLEVSKQGDVMLLKWEVDFFSCAQASRPDASEDDGSSPKEESDGVDEEEKQEKSGIGAILYEDDE